MAKSPALAIILEGVKKGGGAKPSPDSSASEDEVKIAQTVIDAIKDGDAEALAASLAAFVDTCTGNWSGEDEGED